MVDGKQQRIHFAHIPPPSTSPLAASRSALRLVTTSSIEGRWVDFSCQQRFMSFLNGFPPPANSDIEGGIGGLLPSRTSNATLMKLAPPPANGSRLVRTCHMMMPNTYTSAFSVGASPRNTSGAVNHTSFIMPSSPTNQSSSKHKGKHV